MDNVDYFEITTVFRLCDDLDCENYGTYEPVFGAYNGPLGMPVKGQKSWVEYFPS